MYNGPLHDPVTDPDYYRISALTDNEPPTEWPTTYSEDPTERDLIGMYLDSPTTKPQGISIATFLIPRGGSAVNINDYRSAQSKGWGKGWPSCTGASGKIVKITANRSGSRFNVHRGIAVLADLLIDETERRGYLGKPAQCGAYNCRPIGGTSTPSNHSWGLALDWNWSDNPFTSNRKHKIPEWMPQLFNEFGFAWGGHYVGTKKDYMHFEFMGTPAQADFCTAMAVKRFKTGTPVSTTGLPRLELRTPYMEGPAVTKVQQVLKAWYKLPSSFVDGSYGPGTVKEVKRAQANGNPKLDADGIVGPVTYTKLGITRI